MATVLLILALTILILFFTIALVFINEGERRAFYISLLVGILFSMPFWILVVFYSENTQWAGLFLILYLAAFILLLLPFRNNKFKSSGEPEHRFDERRIMFSRAELMVGSERFNAYYDRYPEHQKLDEKFREKPGLLSPLSLKYHPLLFAAAEANFEAIQYYKPALTENLKTPGIKTDASSLTDFIKEWVKKSGAKGVGITRLKDIHLYSHKGRGNAYGIEILRRHEFAIAFTVEMDKAMIDKAPDAETIMESSEQYLKAGTIANQISLFIRKLGYTASPHFDGNYEVICPLVARDSGLGEFGRMGLLMTPNLGPRVRIGVVTTSIPLITDSYSPDFSMFDFCTQCKKCADNCPSRAISFKPMTEKDGVHRWTINHEACFTYWNTIGTDCGKCIQVCPYSHPDNLLHRLVRKGIKNSRLFSSFALRMDDLFYGRKPNSKKYKSPVL